MLLLFISLEIGLLTTASAYYYSFVVLPGQKLVSLFFTYNSSNISYLCKATIRQPTSFFSCLFFQFVYVSRLPICKIFIPFTGGSTSQRGRLCSKRYGSCFFFTIAYRESLIPVRPDSELLSKLQTQSLV